MRLLVTILLALAAWCSPAFAQIGVPSTLGSGSTTSSSASSLTINTGNPVTAGDLVIVGCANFKGNPTVSSVADGFNTYSQATGSNGSLEGLQTFSTSNATAIGSASFTITLSGTLGINNGLFCQAWRVSGATTMDSAAGAIAFNHSVTTGTLSSANEILAGLNIASGTGSPSYTESAGFTTLFDSCITVDGAPFCLASSYQVVSSTSPVTYSGSWSSATFNFASINGFEQSAISAVQHNLITLGVGQ